MHPDQRTRYVIVSPQTLESPQELGSPQTLGSPQALGSPQELGSPQTVGLHVPQTLGSPQTSFNSVFQLYKYPKIHDVYQDVFVFCEVFFSSLSNSRSGHMPIMQPIDMPMIRP